MVADRAGHLGRIPSILARTILATRIIQKPRCSLLNGATLAEASRGFVSDSRAFLSIVFGDRYFAAVEQPSS